VTCTVFERSGVIPLAAEVFRELGYEGILGAQSPSCGIASTPAFDQAFSIPLPVTL
jgi:hypothetical protein